MSIFNRYLIVNKLPVLQENIEKPTKYDKYLINR